MTAQIYRSLFDTIIENINFIMFIEQLLWQLISTVQSTSQSVQEEKFFKILLVSRHPFSWWQPPSPSTWSPQWPPWTDRRWSTHRGTCRWDRRSKQSIEQLDHRVECCPVAPKPEGPLQVSIWRFWPEDSFRWQAFRQRWRTLGAAMRQWQHRNGSVE